MSVSLDTRVGSLPSLPDDGDAFFKKVGDWAFSAIYPGAKRVVDEIQGRFAIGPLDGVAMAHLENQVAPLNCLPVGHLYDHALESLASKLQGTPVGDILQNDVELRTYFVGRRMAEIYS